VQLSCAAAQQSCIVAPTCGCWERIEASWPSGALHCVPCAIFFPLIKINKMPETRNWASHRHLHLHLVCSGTGKSGWKKGEEYPRKQRKFWGHTSRKGAHGVTYWPTNLIRLAEFMAFDHSHLNLTFNTQRICQRQANASSSCSEFPGTVSITQLLR